jgi:flagella basal body P-ring formation protein FlgA
MALAILAGAAPAPAQSADRDEPVVRHAIVEAVRARMGEAADVQIARLNIVRESAFAVASMTATPEPGSRTRHLVRFTLSMVGRHGALVRLGYASAEIHVAAAHVLIGRPVTRGGELTDADLRVVTDDVGTVPFAPLPTSEDVLGGRVTRDLREGEIVTPAMLRAQPLVRSGDTVRTHAVVGQVEIIGHAVAQQSGSRHDRIRLVNPESRRTLFGRVIGAGDVEVIHES